MIQFVKSLPNNNNILSPSSKINSRQPRRKSSPAFTIVELLIVIVVIAIIATITIVAYNGIQDRARAGVAKSDLTQAAKQLAIDKTLNGDSFPPGSGTPPTSLKASSDTTFEYTSDGTTYCLSAVNGNQAYHITNTGSPEGGVCSGHSGPVGGGTSEGITIGSQTWAETNLNIGTMIAVTANQTNNGTIEKYCYNDDEANCDTYGALYQWNEAMAYSTTEGAQGICPAGWHIPSDDDWKTLEMALGMTQAQADATLWRGTDQGTQLKSGGSSGLNIPLAGFRATGGWFVSLGSGANVWSSSESGSNAWRRSLTSGVATVSRYALSPATGFSVRCLQD